MASVLEFNGYGLQTDSIITQTLRVDSMPMRDLSVANSPRSHGGVILNDSQRVKLIQVSGIAKAATAADLENLLDEMKANLIGLEGNLDYVNPAGVEKRHVATLVNGESVFERREGWNITICPFDLTFACYDPFGKSFGYNAEALFSQTDLEVDDIINVSGTYEAKAVLLFLVNSATAITGVSFTNNDRSESMVITTPLVAGDIIKIDTEQKTVKLNDVMIDYDGVFPIFNVGKNSYNVTFSGSAIDWDLTLKYKSTYL